MKHHHLPFLMIAIRQATGMWFICGKVLCLERENIMSTINQITKQIGSFSSPYTILSVPLLSTPIIFIHSTNIYWTPPMLNAMKSAWKLTVKTTKLPYLHGALTLLFSSTHSHDFWTKYVSIQGFHQLLQLGFDFFFKFLSGI